jgi:hypothetical protein
VKRPGRNVLVNVTHTDDGGEDATFAYRARLLSTEGPYGLCEARGGSDIPTGLYHLSTVFDALTRESLG